MNKQVKEIPVYLFTGFLEAGKTKFIQETFEDERFNNGENTLILLCEEGIEEYDKSRFKGDVGHIHIHPVETPEALDPAVLSALQDKYDIERVVVEYNGMWMLDVLYAGMPDGWMIYQEICFADAGTFLNYNANMRSLVVDKLKSCELIVFNRADEKTLPKEQFHKIVRAVSRRSNIAYEYTSGEVEYDDIEDPPPYDMNAPIIEIADEDYAFWYIDFADKPETYDGKTIRIRMMVAKNKSLVDGEMVVGRKLMTCCAADVQYKGMLCLCDTAHKYKSGDWVLLTAKIAFENHRLYKASRGPMLHATAVKKTTPPAEEIASY